jgi:hypothetical protein
MTYWNGTQHSQRLCLIFRNPANDIFITTISFLKTGINYKGPYYSYVFSIKNLLLLLLTAELLRHKLLHGDPPHNKVLHETSLVCAVQESYDSVNYSYFHVDGLRTDNLLTYNLQPQFCHV